MEVYRYCHMTQKVICLVFDLLLVTWDRNYWNMQYQCQKLWHASDKKTGVRQNVREKLIHAFANHNFIQANVYNLMLRYTVSVFFYRDSSWYEWIGFFFKDLNICVIYEWIFTYLLFTVSFYCYLYSGIYKM